MTDAEGLMDRTAQTTKEASGILVYLIEELGDARLRASQLKQYVAAALELVEKSEKKDHFFEVAGDLLHGIPDTLFKMDKALDAAAMAASRMDYEEIKQGLKPEKADELERVLEDVRLQYLNRRSENMNAKSAAEMLDVFAMVTDTSGKVPAADLAGLIDRLEQGHKQASGKDPAQFFREAAEYLRSTPNPSRRELAATLRRVLADNLDLEAGVVQAAGWKELEDNKGHRWVMDSKGEVIDAAHIHEIQGPGIPLYILKFLLKDGKAIKAKKNFKSLKDAQKAAAVWLNADADGANLLFLDFTKVASDDFDMAAGAGEQFKKVNPDISDEAVERINEQHEKNKDVVKEKHADDPNVLTDFEAAFRAAKVAKANADAGNERKAALFGLHAIQEMAEALAGITPKFSDKMLAIASKAETLRSGVVSDAARSDALPVTAGLEDGYGLGITAKFPKGKPADPTENMTDEDAAEWAAMNEQHAEKFKTAASPKAEAAAVMQQVMVAIEKKIGKNVLKEALENPDEEGFSRLKQIQNQLVFATFDIANEAKFGRGPNDTHPKSHKVKQLGLDDVEMSQEAGKWYADQTDAVQNTMARQIIMAEAKKLGIKLDRSKTIYAADDYGLTAEKFKTAGGLPEFFNMTANPIPQLGRVKGFDPVSDNKLQTKDRRFSLVPTNTLSRGALSQILSIGPNDTVALLDVHGKALDCASPKDTKFKLKNMDRWPWTEVRASAAGTWDPSAKYASDDYGLTAEKFKTASDEIEIEYKVQGKDWTPKKFRNGREFEAWYDKMFKKPGFEINDESVESHSEEYLRSLLAADDYGLTAEDDKAARFEQGKPADPTENMSPEDAEEWQANTEQYGDKFKAATYSR